MTERIAGNKHCVGKRNASFMTTTLLPHSLQFRTFKGRKSRYDYCTVHAIPDPLLLCVGHVGKEKKTLHTYMMRNVRYSSGLCNNFWQCVSEFSIPFEYTCPVFFRFLFFSAAFDICRTPLSLLLLLCLQTKRLSCIVKKAGEMQVSHCILPYLVLFF
jgi:hypothetical protein